MFFKKKTPFCTEPFTSDVVDPDKGVRPCCTFDGLLGNLKDSSLNDVLEGEAWKAMEDQVNAGKGDSDLTWEAQAGIGYAFRWGELVLGYRYLAWEQDDDSKVIRDLELYGFGLGGVFRF